MKVKIKCDKFSNLVSFLANTLTDAVLNFDRKGFRCFGADGVRALEVSIDSSEFEEYNAKGEKYAVSLGQFETILKRFKGSVQIAGKDPDMVFSDGSREFTLRTLDMKMVEAGELPELSLKGCPKFTIHGAELMDYLKDAQTVEADTVDFIGTGEKFCVGAEKDMFKVTVETGISVKGNFKSRYKIDYLKDGILDGMAEVRLKSGYALVIKYALTKGITAKYILAPIVEDD